ncbi:DedA family protein [Oecophyllibacter saccharovorans]|uniref:TVP38/TMEM64 family protein n=1 Tax=Oecophyllibacter saccharovorans TaxID=2558360 RepID=UPI001141F91E|nr:VTT domain-containing protein [Oecophyllibacter saccharovorans]QDH14921.1 DedA family protein [Oecophyllibacter saccharovorans]
MPADSSKRLLGLAAWLRGPGGRLALWALVLILLPLLAARLSAGRWLLASLQAWRGHDGSWLVFLAGGVLYCACGLPRQMLALLAGTMFGLLSGTLLACGASTGGAILAYGAGWLSGQRAAEAEFPNNQVGFFSTLRQTLTLAPFRTVLALRFLPVGSALLISVFCGRIGTRFLPFLFATLLGGLPQNVVFVLAGNGLRLDRLAQGGLAAGLLLVSGVLGVVCGRNVLRAQPGSQDDVSLQVKGVQHGRTPAA